MQSVKLRDNVITAKSKVASSPASSEAAFYSLLRTFGLLRQVMEPYFARFGISGSQMGDSPRAPARPGAGRSGPPAHRPRPAPADSAAERYRDGGPAGAPGPGQAPRLESRLTRPGSRVDTGGTKAGGQGHGGSFPADESLFAGHRPNELQRLAALLRQLETHLGTLVPPQSNSMPEGRSL